MEPPRIFFSFILLHLGSNGSILVDIDHKIELELTPKTVMPIQANYVELQNWIEVPFQFQNYYIWYNCRERHLNDNWQVKASLSGKLLVHWSQGVSIITNPTTFQNVPWFKWTDNFPDRECQLSQIPKPSTNNLHDCPDTMKQEILSHFQSEPHRPMWCYLSGKVCGVSIHSSSGVTFFL